MGLAAATGIPPQDVAGLDWGDLVTLADVVAEQNGGKRVRSSNGRP